jgi:hypothetical protein
MKLIMLLISFIGGISGYGNPPPPPPPCNTPQCSSGSFCYSNTNACTACPPGYMYKSNPNAGVSSVSLWGCTICPSGTFSASSSSSTCTPCFSGTFSPSTGSTSCAACPSGTFSASSGSSGCSQCSSCPTGTFVSRSCISTSDIVCTSCTSIANCGTTPTCTSASNSQCASCSNGYYFVSANNCIACTNCQNGLMYETGSCTTFTNRQCSICTTACPAGQMLIGNCAGTSNKFCITCPTGYYKTSADGSPCLQCTNTCQTGFQLNPICINTINSVCLPCFTGYYKSVADSSACLPCTNTCSPGFQLNQPCSSILNPICIACPSGSYKSLADGSPCVPCTNSCQPGFQLNQPCTTTINPICIVCPSGYYKDLADGSTCLPCTNSCSPGFEFNQPCTTTVNPICIACQSGYYKNLADGSPCLPCMNDCEPGGYLTALCTSINNPSCALCPPDTANPNHFSVFLSSCTTCPGGAVSAAGSATCLQCPVGKATFSMINCSNCGTGTYTDTLGSITCKACPAGTANDEMAAENIDQCLPCNPGYYSLIGATSCSACPIGTFNDNDNNCLACPSGSYNNLSGQIICTLCPAGTANSNTNSIDSSACIKCLPGSFSSLGSSTCILCPVGTSANTSGTSICRPNPPGTYTNLSGSINTIPCPPGYYSENNNTVNCTACQPGFYSNQIGSYSATNCILCSPGTYTAIAGSFICTSTKRGYYQDMPGQTTYLPCPSGTANNNIGSTAINACVVCLPGKYQPQEGSSNCLSSPPGYFQNNSGQTSSQPCPAGTYNNYSGSANIEACQFCPAGTYSSDLGANSSTTCKSAPIGTFINTTGSVNYTLCSPGTYQNKTNQTECLLCPAGTFNSLFKSVNQSSCLSSPPGFYTPIAGSPISLPCKPGTFINATGNIGCQLCSPGTFTDINASISCLPCPMGTFALGSGFNLCQPIGNPAIEFANIEANYLGITVQTNFTAAFPLYYTCSAMCQIYINNELVIHNPILNIKLGMDTIMIVYNGTFNSSLVSELSCQTISGINYCTTIPANNVIQSMTLIATRDLVNPYADPDIFFSYTFNEYSLDQTYKFYLRNLEAAVTYSFKIILKIIDQTFDSEPIELGSVTTKPSVPTAPVQDLVKYFIGINVAEHANNEQANLKIHWEPPPMVQQHGKIIGYKVDYEQQERSFITYGPNVNVIVNPAKMFSLFTNETTLIISALIPDTIYNIKVYPMNEAIGIGPEASIQLKTQVSAPTNPPVLTLVSRKATNITVSWTSLTNETGIITKVWIVAEPYTSDQNSSMVVHTPANNSELPELPFPHEGIRGFFDNYNASNPCGEHIIGYTFRSIFSNQICGGICSLPCEYGTPMLDPTTILPTNNQNLTNDNFLMEFIDEDGNFSLRMVPYLSMKKRFVINSTNGGLLGAGKIMLGDGKINPNSLLNNTVIDANLFYRVRLIVFTSENLYAISDPLDISPFEPPATSEIGAAAYIGIGIAFAVLLLVVIIYCCLRTIFTKRAEKQIINDEQDFIDELLTKNKETTSIYFDPTTKIYTDNNKKYPHAIPNEMVYAVPNATNEAPIDVEPYKISMSDYLDVTKPRTADDYSDLLFDTDENNINWIKEDVFAVPSNIIYTETSEEIFETPSLIITNSISNPAYFSSSKNGSSNYN